MMSLNVVLYLETCGISELRKWLRLPMTLVSVNIPVYCTRSLVERKSAFLSDIHVSQVVYFHPTFSFCEPYDVDFDKDLAFDHNSEIHHLTGCGVVTTTTCWMLWQQHYSQPCTLLAWFAVAR